VATTIVASTRPRQISTGSLGLIHLGLAYAYANPALSVSPLPPGTSRVSIVSYINSLGPIWLIAYGSTGAFLIVALLTAPRLLRWAHVAGVSVATTYSLALWAGFALSDPRPTIISALLSLAMVTWHITLSDLYSTSAPVRHRRAA
jgi:hypothetical protein